LTDKPDISLDEARHVVGELMERLKRRGDVYAPPDLAEGFFRKMVVLADEDRIDLETFVDMAIRHFARHGVNKPLDEYERVMIARAIVAEELQRILSKTDVDEEALRSLAKFYPHVGDDVKEELEQYIEGEEVPDEPPTREDMERVLEEFGGVLSEEALMDIIKTAVFGPEKKRMLENITDESMIGSLLSQHVPRSVVDKLTQHGRLDVMNKIGSPMKNRIEAMTSPQAPDSYAADSEELQKTFSDPQFQNKVREFLSELAEGLNRLAEEQGIDQALDRAHQVSKALQEADERWETAAQTFEKALEKQLTQEGPASDPVEAYKRGAPMDPHHVEEKTGEDVSDYTASLEQAQFVVEGIERRSNFRNPLLATVQANVMASTVTKGLPKNDQAVEQLKKQHVNRLLKTVKQSLRDWAEKVGRNVVERVIEELERAEEQNYHVPKDLKEELRRIARELPAESEGEESEAGGAEGTSAEGQTSGVADEAGTLSVGAGEEPQGAPDEGEMPPTGSEVTASGVGKGEDPKFIIDRSFPSRKKFLRILQSESMKILDEGHDISREFEEIERGEAKAHFGWLEGFDKADFLMDVDWERSLEEGVFKNVPLTLYRREYRNKDEPKVAILLDASGSMSGEKMEVAATLAAALFETVGMENVGVWAFRSDVHELKDFEEVKNKRELIEKIINIPAGGGTDPVKPLVKALDSLEGLDYSTCKVIYITDAIFMHDDFIKIRSLLKDRDDVELYALLIEDEFEHTGPVIFKRLTEDVGGGVVTVNPYRKKEVREKLKKLVEMISESAG